LQLGSLALIPAEGSELGRQLELGIVNSVESAHDRATGLIMVTGNPWTIDLPISEPEAGRPLTRSRVRDKGKISDELRDWHRTGRPAQFPPRTVTRDQSQLSIGTSGQLK
jgi:hypothetical protein